jgi:hypothetical protein
MKTHVNVFDLTLFDSNFETHYGNFKVYDFKIYHFLKHHLSYGNLKLIRDMFEGEEDCIKNFMEIEEIVYKKEEPSYFHPKGKKGYYIPFINSIRSDKETFKFLKVYTTKLLKLLSIYCIKTPNHEPLLFKSKFEDIHKLKMKEFKEILTKPEE